MLDYPKVEIQPFKKGGKIRKLKQKQKQKQTQKQIVNVHIGNKGNKKLYVRRPQQPQQPQQQKNMMYYPPSMTTIIQNPNQPYQLPPQQPSNALPDMMALLGALNLRGPKGDTGNQGNTGLTGPQGIQGIQGLEGLRGRRGLIGLEGPQGIQGLTGPQGNQGIQGIEGAMGLRGLRGEQGIQGIKGDIGNQGIQGERGLKGDKGNQGLEGIIGETGLQGIQGVRGDRGLRGPQGQSGVYYPTLEELELQEYLKSKYDEEKAFKEAQKQTEDKSTNNFRENYLVDDFNNLNIREQPMNNPLLDNLSLPPREEKEREVKEQPIRPPPQNQYNELNEEEDENYTSGLLNIEDIKRRGEGYSKRTYKAEDLKKLIIEMDAGYEEKDIGKLNSSQLNWMYKYLLSKVKELNRGEGKKTKGRPRKSN